MRIYGAGLAGLIAAHMLRMQNPTVHEAQSALPDNHGALLRFRSNAAERETGLKFKRVDVTKAVYHRGSLFCQEAPLHCMNSYSQKVTGKILSRSIKSLEPVQRFIAPANFIPAMAEKIDLYTEDPLNIEAIYHCADKGEPIISTIPMPALMKIVGWDDVPEFHHKEIWSVVGEIEEPFCDVYQTIYDSSPQTSSYRFSITGNKFIAEFIDNPEKILKGDMHTMCQAILSEFFGINEDNLKITTVEVKHQYYGKLMPIDEQKRRAFILAMSNEYGIYSVGRFATWRQLLLDDIIQDVRVVEQFINDVDSYNRSMSNTKVN